MRRTFSCNFSKWSRISREGLAKQFQTKATILDEGEILGRVRIPVHQTKEPRPVQFRTDGFEFLKVSKNISYDKLKDHEDYVTIKNKIERFFCGNRSAVAKGCSFIFPVWQYLLSRWIQQRHEVYVVTPFMDKHCVKIILDILDDNKWSFDKHFQDKFHVYMRTDAKFFKPKTDHFDPEKQPLKPKKPGYYKGEEYYDIEGLVTDTLPKERGSNFLAAFTSVSPPRYLHAKFIAGINGQDAEILVTSANFNMDHFGKLGVHFDQENHDSILYLETSKRHFENEFIRPLEKTKKTKNTRGAVLRDSHVDEVD